MLAGVLGLALVIMPLLILSYDPGSRMERLHQPLCSGGLTVVTTDSNGKPELAVPMSGVRVNVTKDGVPFPTKVNLFAKEPGADWKLLVELDSPTGTLSYFMPDVKHGEIVYARAVDPKGDACPAESAPISAP